MINQDATVQKGMVGTATAGAGLASGLEVMQTGLSIVATILGVILTSWIIYKEIRAEMERRELKKLKRRSTDVDEIDAKKPLAGN